MLPPAGFFFGGAKESTLHGMHAMEKLDETMAKQVARAASEFEKKRTGHPPKSVTVVLSGETLVITLHGVLSPAEMAMAKTAAGALQLQEFHRQLFTSYSEPLRQEIKRITGVDVREATAEVESNSGTVVQVFTTGTMVQVFLLAHTVSPETWSGAELAAHLNPEVSS